MLNFTKIKSLLAYTLGIKYSCICLKFVKYMAKIIPERKVSFFNLDYVPELCALFAHFQHKIGKKLIRFEEGKD